MDKPKGKVASELDFPRTPVKVVQEPKPSEKMGPEASKKKPK